MSSSGIEEEAKLWLVLCGEVEQPLAQYGVVLFQVLDQIGLFLHHLLQIRASSVTKIRVCKRSSYKNTSLEGYLKYFSNYAAIKKKKKKSLQNLQKECEGPKMPPSSPSRSSFKMD